MSLKTIVASAKLGGLTKLELDLTENQSQTINICNSVTTFSYRTGSEMGTTHVSADFPEEEEKIGELLKKISALQDVRLRLGAEMADHSGLIRSLVVRAEDARHLEDMKSMRKWYMELNDVNTDLIRGYNIRCKNHQELLEALRQINVIIQKAARLRAGKYKTNIVNLCRTALKNNNLNSLLKIITTGEA